MIGQKNDKRDGYYVNYIARLSIDMVSCQIALWTTSNVIDIERQLVKVLNNQIVVSL